MGIRKEAKTAVINLILSGIESYPDVESVTEELDDVIDELVCLKKGIAECEDIEEAKEAIEDEL